MTSDAPHDRVLLQHIRSYKYGRGRAAGTGADSVPARAGDIASSFANDAG